MSAAGERTYPRKAKVDGDEVELRLMSAADRDGVLAFARKLPVHDLLFMRRDITQPKVVDAWVQRIADDGITSLLASSGGTIHGCAAIIRDTLSWSPHVGELRVVIGQEMRGKGLGRRLIQEGFALALSSGLERLVAHMTADQQTALSVFESLGFRAEGLLRNHVKDRAGDTHDIVVLGHSVARFHTQMAAYGQLEA
ncbi:MAG TPA: GNAT family N-acetyltransferase [Vineibacter sp.]|nr:GNAT family N-acetyltransferase [Vineibacter sp.]